MNDPLTILMKEMSRPDWLALGDQVAARRPTRKATAKSAKSAVAAKR